MGSIMPASLLDILFPSLCPVCGGGMDRGDGGEGGPGFCRECTGGITGISGAVCTVCGIPFQSEDGPDHTCGECIGRRVPFVRARSAVVYDGAALEAIHRFKYRGEFSLAVPLGRMIAEAAARLDTGGFDLVVPVPLHSARLRERGFNQSLLLAREVAKTFSSEVDCLSLKRTRMTRPQIELKGEERRKNVKGAFELTGEGGDGEFKGKSVLLVDDVFTTGATARECSTILKRAGAEVFVATVARVV